MLFGVRGLGWGGWGDGRFEGRAYVVVEFDIGLGAGSVGFVVFFVLRGRGVGVLGGGGVGCVLLVLGGFALICLHAVRGSSGDCVDKVRFGVLVNCLGRCFLVAPGVVGILAVRVFVLIFQVEVGGLGSQCMILGSYLRRGWRLDSDAVGDI